MLGANQNRNDQSFPAGHDGACKRDFVHRMHDRGAKRLSPAPLRL
jgi:hypothetical protein